MSQAFTSKQPIFTVAEVASSLRISKETIRRKILSGELKAIGLSNSSRTTFRILATELVRWLGANTARQLFGLGEGLLEIEKPYRRLRQKNAKNSLLLPSLPQKPKHPPEKKLGVQQPPKKLRNNSQTKIKPKTKLH